MKEEKEEETQEEVQEEVQEENVSYEESACDCGKILYANEVCYCKQKKKKMNGKFNKILY